MTSTPQFLLFVLPARPVWTGVVASDPSDPYMTISVEDGTTGTYGAPLPGNTVVFETTSGARDVGTVRLRSWVPGNATGTTATLNIAETDDVGPQISAGDQVTVLQEWRLWPVYPRIVNIDDRRFQYFEDYDIAWDGQTREWRPVAVLPPPGVYPLAGASAVAQFVDGSFALAVGASITDWSWEAPTSTELTASGQGTEGSPVEFTFTEAGQHPVFLTVTDSNGNTHTTRSWVFVYDPASPGDVAYTDFDGYSDSMDWRTGGCQASFTVLGGATIADFPHDAMVVMATTEELTTATASWPNRENVLFVGWIKRGTIRQQPRDGQVSFDAVTLDGLMRNTSMYPVRIDDSKGPDDWILGYRLTVDRILSVLWHWRSTLSTMAPIVPTNSSTPVYGQDFGPRDLYTAMNDELMRGLWGKVVVNHQGVVYNEIDYNLQTTSERATATTRKTLHKGLWVDDVEIVEREEWEQAVNVFKMSGVAYQWGAVDKSKALFSEAPGDVQEHYGREGSSDNHILTTQADLNTRCGYALARANLHYTGVRASFINDGSFTIAPQEIFPASIEPTDNNRGLSWSPDLVPRSIKRSWNGRSRSIRVDVEFEPSSTGPAGITVLMPPVPPPPEWPDWDFELPPPIWEPPVTPVPGTAGASHYGGGFYWTTDSGASWEERNAGLVTTGATGSSQAMFLDVIWDPWWWIKQGTTDPEQSIMWGCGPGFVVWTNSAGKAWSDITPNMDDPDLSLFPGISSSPTTADLVFKQVHGDIHHQDRFYVLAEYLDGSDWYGWMYVTEDDGATWESHGLGSAQGAMDCDETYCYATYWRMVDYSSSQKVITAAGTFSGDAGDPTTEFEHVYITGLGDLGTQLKIDCDMGGYVSGSALTVNVHSTSEPPDAVCQNGWFLGSIDMQYSPDGSSWTTFGGSRSWADESGVMSWNAAATCDGAFRYVRLLSRPTFESGDCDGWLMWIDSVRVSNVLATDPSAGGAGRPLAMDVDTEDGTRVYVTFWSQDTGNIEIYQYDVSGGMTGLDSTAASSTLGAASEAQVEAKDYWAAPRTPHYPGVAGFGDYVYAFGHWNDGADQHLHLSTDGAASFSDIGDGAWTTERAGAMDTWSDGNELYIFLNDPADPTLWRSLDAGSTWALLGSLPFNVEFEAMYRFYGGNTRFIIGCNTAFAAMAGWQDYPYEDGWTDATGSPSLPTASGFISAIVWV